MTWVAVKPVLWQLFSFSCFFLVSPHLRGSRSLDENENRVLRTVDLEIWILLYSAFVRPRFALRSCHLTQQWLSTRLEKQFTSSNAELRSHDEKK
jgi:hypothetical protein